MLPNSRNCSTKTNGLIIESAEKQNENRIKIDKELMVNLTVYGASAPMCLQQRKVIKKSKTIGSHTYKKKEFKKVESEFPIDKIIRLAERLEMAESKSQQIDYVSAVEVLGEKTTENKMKQSIISQIDTSYDKSFFSSARSCRRETEENCVLLPDLNFSIDLSSISNTNDESDESGNEYEESDIKTYQKKTNQEERNDSYVSNKSTMSSCRYEYKSCHASFSKHSNRENAMRKCSSSFRKTDQESLCSPHHNFDSSICPKSLEGNGSLPQRSIIKGSDMINVYINAMNKQKDLIKYFRPCRVCKELSCLCEPFQELQWNAYKSHKCLPSCRWYEGDSIKEKRFGISRNVNKVVETDDSVTQFEKCLFAVNPAKEASNNCYSFRSCPESSTTFFRSGCSKSDLDRSSFLRSSAWCCGCICDFQVDLNNSVNSASEIYSEVESNTMLNYASSLANAARSARTLARDLESVLSAFKIETDRRNK